jgi:hypothetical protein
LYQLDTALLQITQSIASSKASRSIKEILPLVLRGAQRLQQFRVSFLTHWKQSDPDSYRFFNTLAAHKAGTGINSRPVLPYERDKFATNTDSPDELTIKVNGVPVGDRSTPGNQTYASEIEIATETPNQRAKRRQARVMPILHAAELTRSAFADRAGVPKNVVYNYLSGRSRWLKESNRKAIADELRAIAKDLNLKLENLPS